MIKAVQVVIWIGLLTGVVPHALSADTNADCTLSPAVTDAVDRLQRAHANFSVSGTFLKESSAERAFISSSLAAGDETGSLTYLNASNSGSSQTIWAPQGPTLSACDLHRVYVLSIETRTKVAGRSTSILLLRPRDGLRLGYRLAIDDISGLILRSESLGGDGRLLERHEYASVSITPNDAAVGTQFSQADEKAEITLMQDLELVGLPLGYRGRLARGSEQRALFVSDGIASATVVFEPLPNGLSPGEGAARRGATLTYSRGSIVGGAGVLVTVIGEVPLPAARLIADAVKVVPRR